MSGGVDRLLRSAVFEAGQALGIDPADLSPMEVLTLIERVPAQLDALRAACVVALAACQANIAIASVKDEAALAGAIDTLRPALALVSRNGADCPECEGLGRTRYVGRDNAEVVEDCSHGCATLRAAIHRTKARQ